MEDAINQAQKIAPQVMNDTSAGINALKNTGVDKNFIDSMYKKYGKYANKLGMSNDSLKSTIDQLGKAVGDNNKNYRSNNVSNSNKSNKRANKSFDSKKYPKV